MVKKVISNQMPVIRIFTEISEFLRQFIVKIKKVFFLLLFFLSITDYRLLITRSTRAADLGTHGVIYQIEEEDPIVLIQRKLKKMVETGELEHRFKELQQKTKRALERPRPVEGIAKLTPRSPHFNQGPEQASESHREATKNRVFYYDPTYTVPEDLKDHTGKIFYKKGTPINPLETVRLSQNLLFFDGDDPAHVELAKEKSKEGPTMLILVKGAPLALSKEFKAPVYFDQAGLLTQKLRIKYVPALVTQENMCLRIEEIKCEGKE